MAAIEIEQLFKYYGGVPAVRGIDLEIADGEFFVLLGPSGCGKTSVLRMVAGLESITHGRIRIGDEPVDGVGGRDRSLAMMFQEAALYPHMTVAENIGFPLKMAGASRSNVDRAVTEIAGRLGIGDLLDHRPRHLSGGQRQRVSMARALIREPAVLLMDEPMSHLDAKLRGELRATIAHLQHQLEITTLYVTHDQVEAMSLGDRIGVMRDGLLVQVGTPGDLYDRPVDLFVATFVGNPMMNLLAATLSIDGAVGRVATRRHEWELHGNWSLTGRSDDRRVVLGVRPHAWRFDGEGLTVDVEHMELIGDRFEITAVVDAAPVELTSDRRIDIGRGRTVLRVEVPAAARPQAELWQPSHLVVDPSEIHVFDAETGAAVTPSTCQPTRATT